MSMQCCTKQEKVSQIITLICSPKTGSPAAFVFKQTWLARGILLYVSSRMRSYAPLFGVANCVASLPSWLSGSCALPLLSFACVMPFCSQAHRALYQKLFIDTIVYISVLNDNLPSGRSIVF